jgi:hypothetical protein
MEIVFGVVGMVCGIFGAVYSVVQARRQTKQNAELALKQDSKDRLAFLSTVILDRTLPRSHRQAFYDEYLAKNGNGPVVRLWLLEGEEIKKLGDKSGE